MRKLEVEWHLLDSASGNLGWGCLQGCTLPRGVSTAGGGDRAGWGRVLGIAPTLLLIYAVDTPGCTCFLPGEDAGGG